jgi:aarF domain-containing kinase
VYAGNLLVSKEPPFKPILLDFVLTKSLPFSKKQALAKMLLACAKASGLIFLNLQ